MHMNMQQLLRLCQTTGPYSTVIGRDAGISVTLTDGPAPGRKCPYTATQSACNTCYMQGNERRLSSSHRPYGYSGKCDRCGLFGHKTSQCCQQLSPELDVQHE